MTAFVAVFSLSGRAPPRCAGKRRRNTVQDDPKIVIAALHSECCIHLSSSSVYRLHGQGSVSSRMGWRSRHAGLGRRRVRCKLPPGKPAASRACGRALHLGRVQQLPPCGPLAERPAPPGRVPRPRGPARVSCRLLEPARLARSLFPGRLQRAPAAGRRTRQQWSRLHAPGGSRRPRLESDLYLRHGRAAAHWDQQWAGSGLDHGRSHD